jgi:hypothetical protein
MIGLLFTPLSNSIEDFALHVASAQVRVPRALGSALTSLFPWELGGLQGTVEKLSASPFQGTKNLAKGTNRTTLTHAAAGHETGEPTAARLLLRQGLSRSSKCSRSTSCFELAWDKKQPARHACAAPAPRDGHNDVGKLAAYHSSMNFTVVGVVLFLPRDWQTRTVNIFNGLELGLLANWVVVGDGWVPRVFCPALLLEHLRLFSSLRVSQSSSPQPVYVKSDGDVDDFDHLLRIEPEFDGLTRRTEGRKRQRRVSGRWAASPHRHTRCAHYLTSDVTKCSKSACKTPVKMT